MADSRCAKAELELDEATKKYAEAVNAVRHLASAEPRGTGAKHVAWEAEIGEARRARDGALQTYTAKSEALQKCKEGH